MTLSLPVSAQECGIRRVGGPNRFVDSVDTEAELQSVFKDKWSDIEGVLKEAGWGGDPKDLATAVANGAATEKSFAKGTHFEWMILRKGGKPGLLRDDAGAATNRCRDTPSTSSPRDAAGTSRCRRRAATWR